MHYLTLIIWDAQPDCTATAVAEALAPYRHPRDADVPGPEWFDWDWYEIGGRWDGVIQGNEARGGEVISAFRRIGWTGPAYVLFPGTSETADVVIRPVDRMEAAEVSRLLACYHRDSWAVIVDVHA